MIGKKAHAQLALIALLLMAALWPARAQNAASQQAPLRGAAGAKALAHPAGPKLVVVIVVDQMRGDYVDKFRGQWSGFYRRKWDRGWVSNGNFHNALGWVSRLNVATGFAAQVRREQVPQDGWKLTRALYCGQPQNRSASWRS